MVLEVVDHQVLEAHEQVEEIDPELALMLKRLKLIVSDSKASLPQALLDQPTDSIHGALAGPDNQ